MGGRPTLPRESGFQREKTAQGFLPFLTTLAGSRRNHKNVRSLAVRIPAAQRHKLPAPNLSGLRHKPQVSTQIRTEQFVTARGRHPLGARALADIDAKQPLAAIFLQPHRVRRRTHRQGRPRQGHHLAGAKQQQIGPLLDAHEQVALGRRAAQPGGLIDQKLHRPRPRMEQPQPVASRHQRPLSEQRLKATGQLGPRLHLLKQRLISKGLARFDAHRLVIRRAPQAPDDRIAFDLAGTGRSHCAGRAALLNSTLTRAGHADILRDLTHGHIQFLFLAPEQLANDDTFAHLLPAVQACLPDRP